MVLVLAFTLLNKYTSVFSTAGDYAADSTHRVEMEVFKPIVLYGMVVNDLHVTEDVVKRNNCLLIYLRATSSPQR